MKGFPSVVISCAAPGSKTSQILESLRGSGSSPSGKCPCVHISEVETKKNS